MEIDIGHVLRWLRTFSEEDVAQFGALTGDLGRHHVQRDESGRLMVQGLLTASLATKLGGEVHFIACDMVFEYLRPVFTGDTVTCELQITALEREEGLRRVATTAVFRNQHGKEVITGSIRGIIRDAP